MVHRWSNLHENFVCEGALGAIFPAMELATDQSDTSVHTSVSDTKSATTSTVLASISGRRMLDLVPALRASKIMAHSEWKPTGTARLSKVNP